jgi:type VI secretion system protein ImpL
MQPLTHLRIGIVVAIWLLTAWFLPGILKLKDQDAWILRLALSAITASAVLAWVRLSRGMPEDIDVALLFREAESHLDGRKISACPVVLFIGSSESGRTDVLKDSGVELRLLAAKRKSGQSVGLREMNLWAAADNTIFFEVADDYVDNAAIWKQVISCLRRRTITTVFRMAPVPSRAAVICVDCNNILTRGTHDGGSGASATIGRRLTAMCERLDSAIPIYVLFTRLDRLRTFSEYAAHLDQPHSARPLGVTFEASEAPSSQRPNHWHLARLRRAFEDVVQQLLDQRLPLLIRAHTSEQRRAIYQFPRQFRALGSSDAMLTLLMNVCPQKQLGAGPFLRGFYFTGYRVTNAAAVETRLSNVRSQERVEWVFLRGVIEQPILGDQGLNITATNLTGGTRTKLAMSGVIFLFALLSLGFCISYTANRALQVRADDAIRGIWNLRPQADGRLSMDGLKRLDKVRAVLQEIGEYGRSGPPLRYRLGLYVGDSLYSGVRRIYFDGFGRLMLKPTQNTIRQKLGDPRGRFGETYEALEAYLMTTSNPDRTAPEFLSSVLLTWWQKNQPADAERIALAKSQFDLYSAQQRIDPPFGVSSADASVVGARRYLLGLGDDASAYRLELIRAANDMPYFSFAREFPDASRYVTADHEVPGAYTKMGWIALHTSSQFRWEATASWVLGMDDLERSRARTAFFSSYEHEYARQWEEFLTSARVARFSSENAEQRLTALAGAKSPVLQLLCAISQNVSVASQDVRKTFEPIVALFPIDSQGYCRYDSTAPFLSAMAELRAAVQDVLTDPQQNILRAGISSKADSARAAAYDLARTFRLNQTVVRLLVDPIDEAVASIPTKLSFSGCYELNDLKGRFPFRPSTTDATIEQFNSFFGPTGRLWSFVQKDLLGIVERVGNRYSATGTERVRMDFLDFLNRASEIQETFYSDGSTVPRLKYSMSMYPTAGVRRVTLQLGGRETTFSSGTANFQDLSWTGDPQGAAMIVELEGGNSQTRLYTGSWGIFHLLGEMRWGRADGDRYNLTWPILDEGRPLLVSGSPLVLRFGLSMGHSRIVFQPGYFSSLNCVSRVIN